jgi:short-subunit dehydrogenase
MTTLVPEIFLKHYGSWALITGASSGIGEQFARLLAEQKFNLLLVARREDLLSQLRDKLQNDFGVTIEIIAADLSLASDLQKVIQAAKNKYLGLVVSNAGFGLKGSFTKDPLPTVLSMVQTNAIAPLTLAYELLPVLAQRVADSHGDENRRAGFIFTGSMEGEAAFPWSSAYAASKAFVHSLGNGLWEEYRDKNVDVLVLAPGSTDTNAPISQGISRDQLVGMMSPRDVAEQALQKLGKTPFWLTGLHNRIFIRLLRGLPRSWSIRMAGFGMKSAIEKSNSSLN